MHADFFHNYLINKKNQKYHKIVKQFESRSGSTYCRAWFGFKLFAKVAGKSLKIKTEIFKTTTK